MDDSPAKILLVEDDESLRQAFRLLLEEFGYLVREAGTAAEALLAVADDRPSLVLLDLGLPDRPGLELARELKAAPDTSAMPVVALTGRVGAEERRACLEAGCSAYLPKPIEARTLLRRIDEVLR